MDEISQEDGNMNVAIETTIVEMFLKSTVKAGRLKAGRVLSARNAGRINSALAALIETLDDAGVELDGFTRTPADDDADDGKDRLPVGLLTEQDIINMQKAKDAPAERAAKDDHDDGAGPVDPPTLEIERLKLLLEIEQQTKEV